MSREKTRLYIGGLSRRTRPSDLDSHFGRFGRIHDIEIKSDYAFIEFRNNRDADDAIHDMHRRTIDGQKIIVEWAGVRRERSRGPSDRDRGGFRDREDRDRRDRPRGPQLNDQCFNCGGRGHWANECKEVNQQKCYNCGRVGHRKRDCRYSPQPQEGRERDRENFRDRRRSQEREDRRDPSPRSPRREDSSPPRRNESEDRQGSSIEKQSPYEAAAKDEYD